MGQVAVQLAKVRRCATDLFADQGEHGAMRGVVGAAGLASLYLTLFVHHERPEHQIQLSDEAAMFMADGGPLLGTRPTPDLIPLIAWNEDLASNATSIGPASETRFNDVKHHLSVLSSENWSSPLITLHSTTATTE